MVTQTDLALEPKPLLPTATIASIQITRTPLNSGETESTMASSTVTSNLTPTQMTLPSAAVTTPLMLETPALAETVANATDLIDAPLIVILAHINLETYTLLDEYNLYLMSLDGQITEQLTESDTSLFYPSWSPDCKQLAFVRDSDYIDEEYRNHLILMDIESDHSNMEIKTHLLAYRNPSWSLDGKSLVFEGVDSESTQVYIYDIESEELTQLTNEGNNFQPDWSPDDTQIVFASDRNYERSSSIYVMNADGSEQRQLLPYFWGADPSSFENPSMYNPQEPVWSPDGKWIAFRVTENANDREVDKIYTMTSEGLDAHPIVPGDRKNDRVLSDDFYYVFETNPRWSPDNAQILFVRSNGFTNETSLCIADAFSDKTMCNPIDSRDIIRSIDWCSATNE